MKVLKSFWVKLIGAIIVFGILWLFLPIGPLWFLWYGEQPTETDNITLVSICAVVCCLLFIFYAILKSAVFHGHKEEEKSNEAAAPEESQEAPSPSQASG